MSREIISRSLFTWAVVKREQGEDLVKNSSTVTWIDRSEEGQRVQKAEMLW